MRILGLLGSSLVLTALAVACGTAEGTGQFVTKDGGGSDGSSVNPDPDSGIVIDPDSGSTGGGGDGGVLVSGDPVTCTEAATAKTYVGCDYWPTVTPNLVAKVFDFAIVVANKQTADANITVTGPAGFSKTVTVASGKLEKIFVPWVTSLKGAENINPDAYASVVARTSAYHLVSSVPVVVYQFNPLEYKAVGGPPNKDWSTCVKQSGAAACYSYSNDASLLLPSTAMTGNYRVIGPASQTAVVPGLFGDDSYNVSDFFSITATADGTTVNVSLGSKAKILAGSGVAAQNGGGSYTLSMNAGDVVQLVGAGGTGNDVAGSLVKADKPVQVISGLTCGQFPYNAPACDHVEEIVFPVETLGKEYYVVPPTGPLATPKVPGALVRIHGNFDNTRLTYEPSKPAGCPDTISAGQVIDCGSAATSAGLIKTPFRVTADQPFAVSTFMVGGAVSDPNALSYPKGDPSQSVPTAVEQYRTDYLFLAPDDYDTSFVDIVGPTNARVTLDGNPIGTAFTAIANGYGIARVSIRGGSHKLVSDLPVGIQVMGYGDNTSYQYPGGLDLKRISIVPDK